MNLLTQNVKCPIKLSPVRKLGLLLNSNANPHYSITCLCCKHKETVPTHKISIDDFAKAAYQMGWRHVETNHIDIDTVCPSCAKELHSFYQPQQVPA